MRSQNFYPYKCWQRLRIFMSLFVLFMKWHCTHAERVHYHFCVFGTWHKSKRLHLSPAQWNNLHFTLWTWSALAVLRSFARFVLPKQQTRARDKNKMCKATNCRKTNNNRIGIRASQTLTNAHTSNVSPLSGLWIAFAPNQNFRYETFERESAFWKMWYLDISCAGLIMT